MTKTQLTFPAFSLGFVDFAVQFCFHSTRSDAPVGFDSGVIFLDQSQFLSLSIATNEIASFCIDHRLRQMAFFRAKVGQRRDKRPAFALC